MQPVILADSRGIDYVREIVLRVSEDESRVAKLGNATLGHAFLRRSDVRRNLRRIDCRLRAGKTDKTSIKVVEPGAQHLGSVVVGIRRDEDDDDLMGEITRQFSERTSEIGHMHGADIRASRVAEKKKGDAAFRS